MSKAGLYSPHPRGCFSAMGELEELAEIFPASAGVFLSFFSSLSNCLYIPRIRGGVSQEHHRAGA